MSNKILFSKAFTSSKIKTCEKRKLLELNLKIHSDIISGPMEEDMAIRIEQNLFYVESKGLSLILENRDGYLDRKSVV